MQGFSKRVNKTEVEAEPETPVRQKRILADLNPPLPKEEPDGSFFESQIGKMLGYSTFQPDQRYWLNTGNADLNATLGSRKLGLPYGKIYELSGEEHGGKTTLATILAGLAQKDGAAIGYIDLEDSRDEGWASRLGLDLKKVVQVYPKLVTPGTRKKKKKKAAFGPKDDEEHDKPQATKVVGPRLQSGEDMFAEAEAGMALLHKHGYKKQFWFLDSIANIQTEMVLDAGVGGQNMRTKLDRAVFLSQTLPTWAGLAANYNATIFLLNQLRDKQGVVWGKKTYSTGGRALRHACAIRAEVMRRKGGKVKNVASGKTIGILGTIVNEKNKAGGGSEQNCRCAFKIVWSKTPARIQFMSMDEVEEQEG